MAPDLQLLRPERSAHASIRGYLYQACLGVERWLALGDGEALLCEGDEDLDRLVRGAAGAGPTTSSISEGVKDLPGDARPRVVRETLRNFLWAYHALRPKDDERTFRFTTTAELKKPQERATGRPRQLDLLFHWHDPEHQDEVVEAVRGWVLHPSTPQAEHELLREAVDWLDREDGGWRAFLDAVDWSFGAPDLAGVRDRIAGQLAGDARVANLPVPDLIDRLVWRVLEASVQEEAGERLLTRQDLAGLIEESRESLASWAKTQSATRLRRVFTDAETVAPLLSTGERDLGDIPPERRAPSLLLQAAYQVVPFEGREEELGQILDWCREDQAASVQLWSGDGGAGKSRLWIEACRRLRHQGWIAGFLRSQDDSPPVEKLFGGVAPRLLVVDYAETRRRQVEALLRALDGHTTPRVRLVLLARKAGGWWEELREAGGAVGHVILSSPPPRGLAPLAETRQRQDASFEEAAHAFAETAQGFAAVEDEWEVPADLEPPELDEELRERALYLHMAALLAVEGERPETVQELFEGIFRHERTFWRQVLEPRGVLDELGMDEVERVVAGWVLLGGAGSRPEAREQAGRLLGLEDDTPVVRKLVEGLEILYGGGEAGGYLDPFQPDLLGEALVERVLEREPGLLEEVLAEADEAVRERVLTVLNRLAQQASTATGQPGRRWLEAALAGRLEELVEPALRVILETGEPLGEVLSKQIRKRGSVELTGRLLGDFDRQGDYIAVGHRELAAAASERALELLQQGGEYDQEDKGRLLDRLGHRYRALGKYEAALKATKEAFEVYRQLHSEKPKEYRAELAKTRLSLSKHYPARRQKEMALLDARGAVDLYKSLVEERPRTFEPLLAASYDSLGNRFHALERYEEAFQSTERAVNIRRQLVERNRHEFLPQLATGLSNLGRRIKALKEYEEARKYSREAVGIFRSLNDENPHTFGPYLAASLNYHGDVLSALNQAEEAFDATQESIHILLSFFRTLPRAFAWRMDHCFRTYKRICQEVGKEPDSRLVEEIEEIFRRLEED